jgi:hypothetical protein
MNFMNFVYDDCMTMFTEGQKKRMLAALMTHRAGLLNSSVCNPVATTDNLLTNNVLMYPNPVQDELTVELLGYTEAQYRIFDVAGRQIADGILTYDKNFINVATFAPGFYQIGINIENQYVYKPIVKR